MTPQGETCTSCKSRKSLPDRPVPGSLDYPLCEAVQTLSVLPYQSVLGPSVFKLSFVGWVLIRHGGAVIVMSRFHDFRLTFSKSKTSVGKGSMSLVAPQS